MNFNLGEHSHRRYNPLIGEWIQVSPHRAKRPWQGQTERAIKHVEQSYDLACYLCPGNIRSTGQVNPGYDYTYSFVNDFAAIIPDVPDGNVNENDLLIARSEKGLCKVICFSPDHSLTVAEMPTENIVKIIECWIREYEILSELPFVNYVQIFENKGEVMGCSNPHPHGQMWAQESIPMEPLKKQYHQQDYYMKNGRTLLSDYISLESQKKERLIAENKHFIALVPFWATWPFETMIVPKRPAPKLSALTVEEVSAFAEMYKLVTVKYDNLFETSFPYSAGIHQAPCDDKDHPEWHWHMVFYPPLLRSAAVKKFMVGYEMLANPQRDISAEFSAEKLRALPSKHFKEHSRPFINNQTGII